MDSVLDFVETGHGVGNSTDTSDTIVTAQKNTGIEMEKNTTEKSKSHKPASIGIRVTQCVYLGPDRPFGLPLMSNAILRDAPVIVIPPLEDAFKSYPELEQMFVPVSGIASARQQIKENGSVLHQAFQTIKAASDKQRARKNGGK